MHRIRVHVDFSYDEFRPYYEGRVRDVIVSATDGRRIRFPARILRPYLDHRGVIGLFEIHMDEAHRLLSIKRVGDARANDTR